MHSSKSDLHVSPTTPTSTTTNHRHIERRNKGRKPEKNGELASNNCSVMWCVCVCVCVCVCARTLRLLYGTPEEEAVRPIRRHRDHLRAPQAANRCSAHHVGRAVAHNVHQPPHFCELLGVQFGVLKGGISLSGARGSQNRHQDRILYLFGVDSAGRERSRRQRHGCRINQISPSQCAN